MYYPSLKEFKALSKKGNLIPVYTEVVSDIETPVSAFLKINSKGEKYSFLLESVEGGEKWGRYCFLGFKPSLVFTAKGDNITITKDGKKKRFKSAKGPIEELRTIMSKYKSVEVEGLPRFFGGAVGFFSYDVVRFIEDIPCKNKDDLNIPEAKFMVSDTILIFDHVKKTIKILSCAHIEDGDSAEKVYLKALKSIEAVKKRLKSAIPFKNGRKKRKPGPIKFSSNIKRTEYIEAVKRCKEYIKEGDIFQVALSQRLRFDIKCAPFDIYRALRIVNPSPYMYYLNLGDIKIAGSSPEVMVRLDGRMVETRPIAGTRARGKDDAEDSMLIKELLADPKECAEHVMLVDLGRNDIGRVADIGSVAVTEFQTIEKYSHVIHIVSNVRGKIREGNDAFDLIKATFPAGTLSGAPKVRAMEIIDELEKTRRGLYAGAVGYFSFSGNMDTAISIRTLLIKGGKGYLGVGAGIVADSIPESEFNETMNKARGMIKAIQLAEDGI